MSELPRGEVTVDSLRRFLRERIDTGDDPIEWKAAMEDVVFWIDMGIPICGKTISLGGPCARMPHHDGMCSTGTVDGARLDWNEEQLNKLRKSRNDE